MDTGISAKDRAAIAKGLSRLLADTYVVYLKTHNFHWNVEGPMFQTLHQMFMEQYTEAWNAIDLVAERIRSLGHYAPGTYREYLEARARQGDAGRAEGRADGEAADRRAGGDREDRARGAAGRREGAMTSRRSICSRSACRCTRRTPGCCARC